MKRTQMKVWSVFVVTLTDRLVDVIKLALLDVAIEMKPGIAGEYHTSQAGHYGCTTVAKITLNQDDAKEAFKIVEKLSLSAKFNTCRWA